MYQIVLDSTPFYPEGGGQVGDKGSKGLQIIDTKKENNLILHFTKNYRRMLTVFFVAKVEKLRSDTTKITLTHLMHQALRSILGTHVEQKGR
jgi:alanyl-tRNA synthetase